MSDENRFGIDARGWYGVAGATPSTPLDEANKITLKIDFETGEFPSRATNWKITDVSVQGAEVEVTIMNSRRNAAALNFFWTAAMAHTPIAVKLLDAATNSRGVDADWICTSLSNEQDLTAAQEFSFSLKPTYTTGGRFPTAVTN